MAGEFFRGREFVLVGFGENEGCLYVNSKLLKSYYMLHLEVCGGGGELCGGFLLGRAGLFIPYFGV